MTCIMNACQALSRTSSGVVMRSPAAETAQKHERILDEASKLFRERGFSGVSVGEIMQATGLTHGPFYNHFPSKEALMAESVGHGLRNTLAGVEHVGSSPGRKAEYLDRYFSTAHPDGPRGAC